MKDRPVTNRRTVLKGIGASLALGGIAGVGSAASEWTVAKTETDSSLFDVEYTADGAFAVGTGGIVVERYEDQWRKALDGGPTGNGNDLYGADVTDDADRLWFVGASGAIGEYDVTTDVLYDHSAPMDSTNNYNDVAVTGPSGDANVYVAGDSGKIYYSFENGESGTWDDVTPGSGAAITAIDFYGPRSGHAIDTNGKVYETDDGTTWNAVGIGDADVNFYGLDSDGEDDVTVVGGNGTVFRYDGSQWRSEKLSDADFRDVRYRDGEGYTVGSGGEVFEADGDTWCENETPTGENLKGVVTREALDSVGTYDIAVGSGGLVIEK